MKAIVAIVALAGCADPCLLEIADGSDANDQGLVHPGDLIVFEAHLHDGVRTCGGHWLVNGIEGGSDGFGTIDDCGVYQAPAMLVPGLIEIEVGAGFPGAGAAGDEDCEVVYRTLRPVP